MTISIRATNEQEINRWTAYSAEEEQVGLQVLMTVEAINRLVMYWKTSTDEDRQGMIRNLFEYIVWDFDEKQIVDFRLKPWAENCINLDASLTLYKFTPNRYMTIIRTPEQAAKILLGQLYSEPTVEEYMRERNVEIRRLFAIGMAKTEIGRRFGVSARRVGQIIDEENE